MRKTLALLGITAAAPVLLVVPTTVTPTKPVPHPVRSTVESMAIAGVDTRALAEMRADSQAGRQTDATQAGDDPWKPAVVTGQQFTKPFQMVGVTWVPGQVDPKVRVTARTRTDGRWSDWESLPLTGDHGPDPKANEGRDRPAGRLGTVPYFVGRSDGVQVRVETPDGAAPGDLRLDLVDPGGSPADVDPAPAVPPSSAVATGASGTAPRPAILPRAAWGADESLRDQKFKYTGPVRVAFVHHTETGGNNYSPSDVPKILRGIYAYYVNQQGYGDFPYNFVVDRFGRIWEGRAGGVDRPVHGAHTRGFNTDSMGVALLGSYLKAPPPQRSVDALEALAAWKLSLSGQNPMGKTTLVSEGGRGTRWAVGEKVIFNAISGHTDAYDTSCPGKFLYLQLSRIRSAVRSILASALPAGKPCDGGLCDGGDPATIRSASTVRSATLGDRRLELRYAAAGKVAWARLMTAQSGDEIWIDRTYDNGKSWEPDLGRTRLASGRTSGWTSQWRLTEGTGLRACIHGVSGPAAPGAQAGPGSPPGTGGPGSPEAHGTSAGWGDAQVTPKAAKAPNVPGAVRAATTGTVAMDKTGQSVCTPWYQ